MNPRSSITLDGHVAAQTPQPVHVGITSEMKRSKVILTGISRAAAADAVVRDWEIDTGMSFGPWMHHASMLSISPQGVAFVPTS